MKSIDPIPDRPFAFALHFIRHYRLGLALMLLFETVQAACPALIASTISGLIDTMKNLEPSTLGGHLPDSLSQPLLQFILLSVALVLASRASGTILVLIGPVLRNRTRRALFRYLQDHSQRFFANQFAGSIANRISETATAVNHTLWTLMFDFWPVIVSFSVSITLLAFAHSSLALLLGTWLAIYVSLSFLLARRCRTLAKDFAAARSAVSGKVVDAVSNQLTVRLFAGQGHEQKLLDAALEHELKMARRNFWFMEIMRWFQFIASYALLIFMILFALNLWMAGDITLGVFALVFGLSTALVHDASGLSRRFLEFFEHLGNINDGVAAIIKPHDLTDAPDANALHLESADIDFQDVTFAHPGGAEVFKHLNLHIPAGQKVGLVGPSGAGKSSFVNLLLRLSDVDQGSIKISGQDLRAVSQDSLHQHIAMIPQEPMLFHRSLIDNIRYGRPEASDDEVIAAAREASCDEFISSRPEGYATLVGERGIKLSGGQRQRIAIARAILKDAPILVLDEATSALDSESERVIQESLGKMMEGRTVLVIAHRLSTIAAMDRILVFEHGRIIEDGDHAGLIAQDGLYARLWKTQTGGFIT
jgi:ATP-binding cassette, subfamily B, bacterial